MNVCIAQHVPFEGPGAIAPILEARGHRITIIPLYETDAGEEWGITPGGRLWPNEERLPEVDTVGAWISMGGPMSVHDTAVHPWIPREQTIIRELHRLRRPVFGVCLGAQQIGTALGSTVSASPEVEIGWYRLNWNSVFAEHLSGSRSDAVKSVGEVEGRRLPDSSRVLHWHGEMVSLPEGSLPVGSSEACLLQGFFFPDQPTVGLQFHLEMDTGAVESIVEGAEDELRRYRGNCWVQNVEEIRRGTVESSGAAMAALATILEAMGL